MTNVAGEGDWCDAQRPCAEGMLCSTFDSGDGVPHCPSAARPARGGSFYGRPKAAAGELRYCPPATA